MAAKRIGLIVLLAVFGTSGLAQTYTKLFSKGSWTLYRLDQVTMWGDDLRESVFDGVCMAEYSSDLASLQFSTMPKVLVARRPDLKGWHWVQIASPNWKFRSRTGFVRLSVGVLTYTSINARFEHDRIKFNATNLKDFRLFLTFAGSSKTIDVIDRRGQVIARFPTNGFSQVRDRLWECAGL